jgi:uncharacterized membrane protein YphA (DoxX/SURF4 family)
VGGLGYVYALVLAAVFVWAGAAKLARPAQTKASFEALRVPAASEAARLVPISELVLSVLLVAVPPFGGAGSLVMLAAFTALLIRAIAAGTAAPCACFGAVRAEPVSAADVLRNALLAALAVAALLTPAPVAPSGTEVALAVAACVVGALVVRAARES